MSKNARDLGRPIGRGFMLVLCDGRRRARPDHQAHHQGWDFKPVDSLNSTNFATARARLAVPVNRYSLGK